MPVIRNRHMKFDQMIHIINYFTDEGFWPSRTVPRERDINELIRTFQVDKNPYYTKHWNENTPNGGITNIHDSYITDHDLKQIQTQVELKIRRQREAEEGAMGGKRKSRKSRKPRKSRKSKKSRKPRKSRKSRKRR